MSTIRIDMNDLGCTFYILVVTKTTKICSLNLNNYFVHFLDRRRCIAVLSAWGRRQPSVEHRKYGQRLTGCTRPKRTERYISKHLSSTSGNILTARPKACTDQECRDGWEAPFEVIPYDQSIMYPSAIEPKNGLRWPLSVGILPSDRYTS